MKVEYKIKFEMPKDYDPSEVLQKLPSPISPKMTEIYNYSVEPYGFYFLDNLADQKTAGHAMKLFVDECFKYSRFGRPFYRKGLMFNHIVYTCF